MNKRTPEEILTLSDLLINAAQVRPDADAVVFPDSRQTYAELLATAREWAKAFMALGVQPKDNVGLLMTTQPEFVAAMFGASLAGAAAVPINARYAPAELAYLIENADICCLVTTDKVADAVDFVGRLNQAFPDIVSNKDTRRLKLAGAAKLRSIIVTGQGDAPGFLPASQIADLASTVDDADLEPRIEEVDPSDLGLILYTSGTTSNPKGCMIPHSAIVSNSRALGRYRYKMTEEDRFWSPLPIFHIAGILPMVAVFDVGGAYLTIPHFDAGMALRMLEAERATMTYPSFVTIMQDLINHPDFPETDLSRIRLMNSNLGVQPAAIKSAILKAMPQTIQVGTYGLTEASGTVCTSRLTDDEETRTSRLGVPLRGWELKILNIETGEPCGVDEKGDICIRGPGMLVGYYKDPDKTSESIDEDGWLHTGDLGSLDANGQIMFHGRTKDMLKVGGENVAAAEIEAVLNTHPAVELAQIVGAPDARYEEVPAAFVKLKPASIAEERELIDHCAGKLARFKIPRYVRFVDEWPMSTSKIQKYKLKDQIVAELAAASSDVA
ncbi:MAG: AMP-binding protein [Alphaproteobacteria bacterium]|nr:AMP-binding protein [Alphaproteobacteria bacterium]